ncbi:MAG: SGNH/GDSL hydrolase family protein [Ornithinimicrobium sp.]
MVQQGVDPAVFSELLSAEQGEPVSVFNAASSRARWGINRMLARYIVAREAVPKVALIGITTRAGENDVFYRNDASISAFSAVVEGCDRPVSDVWTEGRERACKRSQSDLVFRFRNGGGQIDWARAGYPLQTSLQLDHDSRLREDGMILHPGVEVDEAKAVSDERMKRGFPGFPRNDDVATQEFTEMVRILEEAGVTTLAFEVPYTPVHQDNLEDAGRNYDGRRQEVARTLAESAQVPLFPVERFGPWWGDGDSRDAIHLSPQGAASFTKQLVDVPELRTALKSGLEE